jgi:predicted nucleic acid-binding protein
MARSPDNCRAVADSNVIIAAQRSTHAQSPNRELIERWRQGEYDFLYSADTLAEYAEKLLALGMARADVAAFLALLSALGTEVVFLTDGPTRTVKIGSTTVQLRGTTARNMAAAGRLSGLLIQAFRKLSKEHVTPERRKHLKRTVPADQRRELLKDLRLAPAGMHPIFRELAEDDAPTCRCRLPFSNYRTRARVVIRRTSGCQGPRLRVGLLYERRSKQLWKRRCVRCWAERSECRTPTRTRRRFCFTILPCSQPDSTT